MHRFLKPGTALFILLLSGQVLALTPEMVTIPGTDYEVNGPTYTYEICKYEITNAQYCAFLNDAEFVQQTNPSD
ncbi:MAG: hypothetical protein GY842_04980, partial [bacterium]|nr:hypothetical protein [bacterium]